MCALNEQFFIKILLFTNFPKSTNQFNMLEKVVNATSVQLNISYRCSENSGMVTRHNQSKFAMSVDGLRNEDGANKVRIAMAEG